MNPIQVRSTEKRSPKVLLNWARMITAVAAALAYMTIRAHAQEVTGTPGSPSATTTIPGYQLPPPPRNMRKLSLVALAVVAATAALAAGGKTRPPVIIFEACQRAWYRAVDGGVSLAYDRASQYFTNLKSADPDQDGVFTKSEFVDACKRGLLRHS